MTISTYQLFKQRYMVIYDHGSTRYKKFIEGCSLTKIIAGSIQVYFYSVKDSITKLLRG